VGYATTNVIDSSTSSVIASFVAAYPTCGHDTENIYNGMHTGTINVILAKHRM